jgi:transposase-like protein
MKGHGTKFGRKQEEAVAALLTQRNIEEAAKTIGIAPNTLLKWMKGARVRRGLSGGAAQCFWAIDLTAPAGVERRRLHSPEDYGGRKFPGIYAP